MERTTLTAAERLSGLGHLWREALTGLRVWHPNASSAVLLHLSSDVEPVLRVSLDRTLDTRDQTTPMRSPFVISCVRLTFFPGTWLARKWFAAGFAGYVTHEALELVTVGGMPVLDPHAEPYPHAPSNRGLRLGLPPVLTPDAMLRTFAIVMSEADARDLVHAHGWVT